MIKQIDIQNLRGIRNTHLNIDNKSVVIFGENGKGKSSIIDGIEYAITGDIKHVSSQCKEVTLKKHAPNIYATYKDIRVQIVFEDGSILSNENEPEMNTMAYRIKNSNVGTVNILRRSQLLNAIFAKPKQRYDILNQFLPLTEITKYENALKEAREQLHNKIDKLLIDINSHKKNIMDIIRIQDLDLITYDNILTIIKNRIKEVGIELGVINSIYEIPQIVSNINSYTQQIGNIDEHTAISNFVKLLNEIATRKSPEEIVKIIFDNVHSKLDLVQKRKIVFYEEFLKIGLKWMKEENKSICPFCESQIDVQKVTERINERIKENSEYSMIKKEFENNYNELQIEIKWWEDQVYKIKELNNQFNDEYIMHLCKLIENNIDCYKKSIPQNIEDVIIKHDIPKWDNSILRDTNYLIKKYSSKLLPSDVVSLLKKVIELRNDLEKIYNNVEMIDKKCNKKKIIDREYELINDFYEELICQRKRSVQGIYNEIKEDINKYYNTIHPDENIGDIELKVKDSASQGSALIEARFYEKKGEDPRAYYSESHLDTLGLAIFLALYKREYMKNKDLKFLVLDDVLTSVDASHRINIMNLIFTEFKEHQLIITTHDIVLFNEIIELEKQYGGKSKFKNIQIYEWTDKCGPQLDDTKSEFQKLIDYYSDSKTDGNILASYTGLFLELILRKLRYSLELAIPAKYYEKYTIADIWDNLYSKLKKNKEYYSKNSIVIDTINTHKFIRNSKGCHYNEWAQGISIDEIKMFTKNVIKFYETIYCSYCGTIIKKNNNDDYQCNCYKLIYKKDYKDSDS